jgi:hypothetical protein
MCVSSAAARAAAADLDATTNDGGEVDTGVGRSPSTSSRSCWNPTRTASEVSTFQTSATEYVSRAQPASLEELHSAADALQAGALRTIWPPLVAATAVGGARPKVLLTDGDIEYIAKLATSGDRTGEPGGGCRCRD